MERAEPLLEGKMADGLNVISTSSLSSPQQITVFALYTFAVSTHSLLLSTGKIRIRMREMRMKTLLLLHPWTSKLWLVPAGAALSTIIPQASWALLATRTSSLVFLFAHCNAWLVWGAHDPFFLLFLFHLLFLLWGSWLDKWSRAAGNLCKL